MIAQIVDVTEQKRLNDAREAQVPWKKWGPYLSERQWGTVREDYSEDGNAWNYFTHDQARSRAYKFDVATVATSQRPAPPVRGTVIGSAAAAMLVAPANVADTPRHRIGPHVRTDYFTAMKEDDQPTYYGRKE